MAYNGRAIGDSIALLLWFVKLLLRIAAILALIAAANALGLRSATEILRWILNELQRKLPGKFPVPDPT